MLARVFDPPAGSLTVRLGAVEADLCSVALEDWRAQVAVAPQRPFLFSDSIRDNVSLADEPDPADVARAVGLAALQPDLEAFPAGLDTVVGQRGIML